MGLLSKRSEKEALSREEKAESKKIEGEVKCCVVCGQNTGSFVLADGNMVCAECISKARIPLHAVKELTADALRQQTGEWSVFSVYSPTKRVYGGFDVDEDHRAFRLVTNGAWKVYRYENLLSFELMEDGDSVSSGGLGRAAVGGLLLGPAGAIVGASTGKKKTKEYCNSLRVRISLKDADPDLVYISLINSKTKRKSKDYKLSIDRAQECLTALEQITANVESQKGFENPVVVVSDAEPAASDADEIRKYKQLADEGIISQEEFEAKKKQLLGL